MLPLFYRFNRQIDTEKFYVFPLSKYITGVKALTVFDLRKLEEFK